MDFLLGAVESLGLGLALVLAAIGLVSAKRFSERRFAIVGAALVVLGAVSLLGLLGNIAPGAFAGTALGLPTGILLVTAELLLYVSLLTPGPTTR